MNSKVKTLTHIWDAGFKPPTSSSTTTNPALFKKQNIFDNQTLPNVIYSYGEGSSAVRNDEKEIKEDVREELKVLISELREEDATHILDIVKRAVSGNTTGVAKRRAYSRDSSTPDKTISLGLPAVLFSEITLAANNSGQARSLWLSSAFDNALDNKIDLTTVQTPDEQNSKTIIVRVGQTQAAKIDNTCSAAGITRADWLRKAAAYKLKLL